MESHKELFTKFTERLNTDLSNLEKKSLNDVKEIKSIYKTVSEIEILLSSCVSISNKIANSNKNESSSYFISDLSENCKNDENEKRKYLQSHRTVTNFSKKPDNNQLKVNRINESELKKNNEDNEKKNYPKTPIKNKENFSSMKFKSTNTLNKDLNEDESNLSNYKSTPLKSLAKSVSKINITSPVKHTISSLNKTRTKESIEKELHLKREEKEYDFRLTRLNYKSNKDANENNIVLKIEVSPEGSMISITNKKLLSDEANKDDLTLTRQTLKSSKSTKKILNTNFSKSNLILNNTTSSKNSKIEVNINSTKNLNNDIKEENSTSSLKVEVKRKSTAISKTANSRDDFNNLEPYPRKILKETKTEKKITRDKTPYIKEKQKESDKIVNKTVNVNSNYNTTNSPVKAHKNSDFTTNQENGSKSLANTNNVNNRKSFTKKSVKNETGNGNGNAHSDGKSLVKTKTEKIIVSNFNPTDNIKEKVNLEKEKNIKIFKKEKTEAILNKNSSVGVSKIRQTVNQKENSAKAKESLKDIVIEKDLERKSTENGEPNGNSSLNENQNVNFQEETLNVVAKSNPNAPRIIKPIIKKKGAFFKTLKSETLVNICQYLIESSNPTENKQVLMKINKTLSKIALDNLIQNITHQKEVIGAKFDIFKNKHKIEDLTKEAPNFNPSMGALRAVEMLNGASYKSIFLSKTILNPEVILAYRVFFQLFDYQSILQIQDYQEFFNKACDYLTQQNPEGKIAEVILASVKIFDFSSENVYKINKFVGNHITKITPTYYSKICPATGLLIFLLKDAIEYAGVSIVEKKTPIHRIYNNYNYNIDIFNSKIERLNFYLMKYHGQK